MSNGSPGLSLKVIGHCGDTSNLDYLEQLIGAGSYIGMDSFRLGYDSVIWRALEHGGPDV